MQEVAAAFETQAASSSMNADFDPTAEAEAIRADLTNMLAALRGKALQKLYLKGQNKLVSMLDRPLEGWSIEPLSTQLANVANAPTAIWPNIRRLVALALPYVQENIRLRLVGQDQAPVGALDDDVGVMCGFRASDEELANFIQATRDFAVDHLTTQLRQTVSAYLQNHMRNRFESSFLRTASGVERNWLPGIDVQAFYEDSVDDSLFLLDLLSVNRVEERHALASLFSQAERAACPFVQSPCLDGEFLVLQPEECDEQRRFFLDNVADPLFQAAKRKQEAAVTQAVAAAEAARVNETPEEAKSGATEDSLELATLLLTKARQSQGRHKHTLLTHAASNFANAAQYAETASLYYNWGVALYAQAQCSVALVVGTDGREEALSLCRQAETKLKRALAMDPEFPTGTYQLGNVLFEIAGLSESPEESLELYKKARELYDEAHSDAAHNVDILINWGVCLSRIAAASPVAEARGLYDQACAKYKQGLTVDPSRGDVLLNWGVALAEHAALLDANQGGDMYNAACSKFSGTIDVDAKLFDALFNWGNALTAQASRMPDSEASGAVYKAASDKFSLFVQANPGHTPALANWSVCLYRDGLLRMRLSPAQNSVLQAEELFKQAEQKLRQVLTIHPSDYDAILKLGLILGARAGVRAYTHEAETLFGAANECYRKAACLQPREGAVFANWGLLLHRRAEAASARRDQGEADRLLKAAVGKLRVAVELGSKDAALHWGQTLLLQSQGEGLSEEERRAFAREAQAQCREAATAYPKDAAPHKCIGDAFYRLGELEVSSDAAASFYDSAKKSYLQAKEVEPEIAISIPDSLTEKLQGA